MLPNIRQRLLVQRTAPQQHTFAPTWTPPQKTSPQNTTPQASELHTPDPKRAPAPATNPGASAAAAGAAGVPPSWVTDLDAYLAASGGTCPDPATAAARRDLVAAVKASPSSPETWIAFLSAEEASGAGGGLTGALTGGLGPLSAQGAGSGGTVITLYHLYFWATQLVPRARNQHLEDYVKLWLGYARQQW